MLRILSGRGRLDKLPYWLALPAGALVGLWLGYRASSPGVGPKLLLFLAIALLAVLGFGMRAPRPARRGRRMTKGSPTATRTDATPVDSDSASDDSLCD